MRSHVDPDATEGCQTGSPQVASNSVYMGLFLVHHMNTKDCYDPV